MSVFGGLWKHEDTQHALEKWQNNQVTDGLLILFIYFPLWLIFLLKKLWFMNTVL